MNNQNLQPFEPGQSGNPAGKKPGTVNRKTILNFLLFEADFVELGVAETLRNKPAWFDKIKPKTMYEMMTMAMAIQAMTGDVPSFNALNKALGLDINAGGTVDVVHIFKPEKLSAEEFNAEGARLRQKTRDAVEGEVINDNLASPTGPTDHSLTSPG